MNAKSANQLEEFICSKHLTIKKDFHVEKISVPESSGEVWRRICHGLKQKRSLYIAANHETDMLDIPCPLTQLSCYSTKAVQAPTGVLNTLECVGFPRQQASLPSLELICGAMKQFPSFQEFLQDTKFERQMEGQELWGIVLHAVVQTYFPL